jgi:hypothetical protein
MFGIPSLLGSPAGMQYDAEFFCASVLPDIERNLCDGKHRKTLRGVYLHLDNAPAHNAKRSRQAIARTKTTRIVHPDYSPDTAPSDFFLFVYLKGEMAGLTADSPADILSEIRRIFQEFSRKPLWLSMTSAITRSKRHSRRFEMSELLPGHKLLERLDIIPTFT